MFEMQSVLQGPASSKRQMAALAAFFHLTAATVLLVGLAWRIDNVEAPTFFMEALVPVAFLPAEWSAPIAAPASAAPVAKSVATVQPEEVTEAPPLVPAEMSSEPIVLLDPAASGAGSAEFGAAAGTDPVAGAGGGGLSGAAAVLYRPDMLAPQVLYRIDPRYPDAARIAHRQGTVVVEAEIATDGTMSSARVVSSPLGFGLEQSALDAIRSWKFAPARYGERPIAVYYRWNILFSLR